ncbi:MAG: right-handed parallel beta-helix repeat-containing protein [Planctomycetota bacterium]
MKIYRFKTSRLASLVSAAMVASAASAQTTLYVDDDTTPGGDGLSWQTAYRFLQDALGDALASGGTVTEIHVAQGTHTPDRDAANPNGTGDREATFQLISGVAVMGGFAGLGAPDPEVRDLGLYETVLSGDLLGNDGPNFTGNEENAYSVVTGSGTDLTAVIDGFTITAGNADGPDGSPLYWQHGAGMWNSTGSPTVQDCLFQANLAQQQGGGMSNYYGSSPDVTNCTFIENVAVVSNGGGMRNFGSSSPTVTGCTFAGNSTGSAGGGMISSSLCEPVVTGCIFEDNYAIWGGGMENADDSDALIVDCIFRNNTAEYAGGGLHNIESSPELLNCQFLGNQYMIPQGGGGGIINFTGITKLTNCLFAGNQGAWGAGLLNWQGGNAVVTNCTFAYNVAFSGGGGISNGGDSHPTVTNSIFWENVAEEIRNDANSSAVVTYSNVQGGYLGTGNINLDPLFVNPGGGDYRSSGGSPGIDAASNSAVPAGVSTDLDGNPRQMNDPCAADIGPDGPLVVDMGAYEFQCTSCDLVVDGDVGISDFLALLANWGPCVTCDNCPGDFDGDCEVGVSDFLILLANWGPCP